MKRSARNRPAPARMVTVDHSTAHAHGMTRLRPRSEQMTDTQKPYDKEDDTTCCSECAEYSCPEDDFCECNAGHSTYGEWTDGDCPDWSALSLKREEPNDV